MPKAIESSVKPSVLRWARETSGTNIEEAAKRLRVPASKYAGWETVESSLTLSQMRALATYFKRPLAAMLLPEPPSEPALPTDFRNLRRDGKSRVACKPRARRIGEGVAVKMPGKKTNEE